MSESSLKASCDICYLIFFIFMSSSVSYFGIITYASWFYTDAILFNLGNLIGIISIVIAGVYKITVALSPAYKSCSPCSLSSCSLILPFSSLICSIAYFTIYLSLGIFPTSLLNAIWFVITLVAIVSSFFAVACNIKYYNRPINQGLLSEIN